MISERERDAVPLLCGRRAEVQFLFAVISVVRAKRRKGFAMQTYSQCLPDAFVRHLLLPRSMVTLTIRKLREAGRITRGYRMAPPPGQRDIARIVLALSAMKPTAAVEHGRTTGRLCGPGGNAEDALVDLIEAAVGIANHDVDLTNGEVVIGQKVPLVEIHSGAKPAPTVYGKRPALGAAAYTHLPTTAIARIAQEILHV